MRDPLLSCRPAREDDLAQLLSMVRDQSIASMRAELQEGRIARSLRTLESGDWRNGELLLITELWSGDGPPRMVGCASLRRSNEGFWTMRPGESVLRYEAGVDDSDTIELAGSCVAAKVRGDRDLKIGTFHAIARIAFLLMHAGEIGHVSDVFANLLTVKDERGYPFYEDYVRAHLADLSYDEADRRRYTEPGFLNRLRDVTLKVTDAATLGALREATKPALGILKRLGFVQVPKYDSLDGGMYVQAPLTALHALMDAQALTVKGVDASETEKLIFAPPRPAAAFLCVKSLARKRGDRLEIAQEAADALGLSSGEKVKVFHAGQG